jgi:hypothetical protein
MRLPVRDLYYAPLKELDREELIRELVKRNHRLTLDLIKRVQAGDRLTLAEQSALAECEFLDPPSKLFTPGRTSLNSRNEPPALPARPDRPGPPREPQQERPEPLSFVVTFLSGVTA